MALPKLYEQIVWHNNTTPAINEDNLNSMSQAIEDIDDRVIEIASTIMEDVPVIEEALEALDPPIRVVKDFAGVQALTDALEKNAVDVKIKITPKQAGSGTPSPDNIRAITGFTEAKVTRTGKNLLKNNLTTQTQSGITYTVNADKTITCTNSASGNYTSTLNSGFTLKKGTYILSGCPSGGATETYRMQIVSETNGGYLGFDTGSGVTFTVTKDCTDAVVAIRVGNGTNMTGKVFKPMIRANTIADNTYEQYVEPTVYTISLGDTRYLAELDVTTGVLTVTGGYIASYASETLPGAWISDRDAYTEGGTPTTGAQVVYELATPVTVQLTATEVALLYAYNTLWADTGDLALTYDASGVLRIANGKLDIDTFKSIVASSSDFADFKSKVAAL